MSVPNRVRTGQADLHSNSRLAYERAIRRSALPSGARLVALTIATWADVETGVIPERFQPSLGTLAEATGLATSSVKRHLIVLETNGWLGRRRPEGEDARIKHIRTAYSLTVPAGGRPTVGQGQAEGRPMVGHEVGPQSAEAGPTVGHKSSLSSPKVPLSPVEPDASPPEAPSTEREKIAAPTKTPTAAQKVVRASGAVPAAEEAAFIAWVTAKHQVHSPGFWRTAADDIPELVEAWRADSGPTVAAVKPWLIGVPKWCGNCGDGSTAAATNIKFRTLTGGAGGEPCPDCHPAAISKVGSSHG